MEYNDSLNVPLIQSQQSYSNIFYHGVVLWNNLNDRTRNVTPVSLLKYNSKQYLLS